MTKPQTIEDVLEAPTRLPAIITQRLSDGKGGYFIRASCPFVFQLTPGTDYKGHDARSADENHAAAAMSMLATLGYSARRWLIMGRIGVDKCVFVQAPAEMLTPRMEIDNDE